MTRLVDVYVLLVKVKRQNECDEYLLFISNLCVSIFTAKVKFRHLSLRYSREDEPIITNLSPSLCSNQTPSGYYHAFLRLDMHYSRCGQSDNAIYSLSNEETRDAEDEEASSD